MDKWATVSNEPGRGVARHGGARQEPGTARVRMDIERQQFRICRGGSGRGTAWLDPAGAGQGAVRPVFRRGEQMTEMGSRDERLSDLLDGIGELFHEQADIDEMMDVVAVYLAGQWFMAGVRDDVPDFLMALANRIMKAMDKIDRALTPTGMVN